MSFIEFDHVSCKYPSGVTILDDLSFTIEKGEFVVLIGPNGCGKSTVAKLLSGLSFATSGKIVIDGNYVCEDDNLLQNIRSNLSLVFQNPDSQFFSLTVEDEIAFTLENLNYPREIMVKMVDDVLTLLKINYLKERDISTLSGGEKQKIALASVLVTKPEILILDEINSMLDSNSSEQFLKIINFLHKQEHKTILMITHNYCEALLADKIIMLNSCGKIEKIFKPQEITKYLTTVNLPYHLQLKQKLIDSGMPISENILEEDDLIEEICKLLSKI